MRIAILAIYVRSGDAVGLQLIHWTRLLQEAGHTVELYVEALGAAVPQDVLGVTRTVDGATFHRSPFWPALQSADLVICDYPAYYALAEALRLLTAPPILWSYHGVSPPDRWLDAAARQYLAMSQRRTGLVHFASLATTRSAWTRDELHSLTGFPHERIVVMPCIVPAPIEPKERVSTSPPYILHVGRVAAHKRPEILLEAMALVRRSIPDAHLVLAGDAQGPSHAPVVQQLQRRAAELGISDAVCYTGSVEQDHLESLYRSASVVVSASAHEGFCVPMIEAMARGVSVVVTATAALPETVGDGGIVVADEVEALAAALVRVLDDQALRKTLISRGFQRARLFESEVVRDQLLALIERAAALPNRNRPAPRLRQLVDLSRLQAGAEVAASPPEGRAHPVSRIAAFVRAWFQSDLRRQFDELQQRQVAFNRQLTSSLIELDEWSAEASERQAATTYHDSNT